MGRARDTIRAIMRQRRARQATGRTAGTGVSSAMPPSLAARQAAEAAMQAGGLRSADLVILFATPHYLGGFGQLHEQISQTCGTDRIVGCSASGLISEAGEIEGSPALGLMAIGGVQDSLSAWLAPVDRDQIGLLARGVKAQTDRASAVVLLAGLAASPSAVVEALDRPDGPMIVGAAASGSPIGPQTFEWCGGELMQDGLAGINVGADLSLVVGVAQGCQPLGEPLLVTRGEGNVIREIGFRPAVQVLREAIEALPEADRARLRGGMFIGLVADEYKPTLGRGDFLVRNIVGMDPESGAIAVGDSIRVGQSVQFQLRDTQAAHQDLAQMLDELAPQVDDQPPRFGLYFNCLGRGRALYGQADHDVTMIRDRLDALPLLGFFGNAELAPLAGRNRVHNYTGVLVLAR